MVGHVAPAALASVALQHDPVRGVVGRTVRLGVVNRRESTRCRVVPQTIEFLLGSRNDLQKGAKVQRAGADAVARLRKIIDDKGFVVDFERSLKSGDAYVYKRKYHGEVHADLVDWVKFDAKQVCVCVCVCVFVRV